VKKKEINYTNTLPVVESSSADIKTNKRNALSNAIGLNVQYQHLSLEIKTDLINFSEGSDLIFSQQMISKTSTQ
jgi:hypothetical protein